MLTQRSVRPSAASHEAVETIPLGAPTTSPSGSSAGGGVYSRFTPPSIAAWTTFEVVFSLAHIAIFSHIILIAHYYSKANGGYRFNENENIHGTFMTFGLVFLNGEALLMYRFLRSEMKLVSKSIHGIFHLLAIAFFSTGLASVVKSKNTNQYTHFYSFHSWFGLGIMSAYVIQFLFGFFNYALPGVPLDLKKAFMPYHRKTGVILFAASVAQCLLGHTTYVIYSEDYYGFLCYGSKNCKDRMELVINFSQALLVLYAVLVMILVNRKGWRRAKTPDEE